MVNYKKTLVMGASSNPSRYSHLAVKRLIASNHPVIAFGKQGGQIEDTFIETTLKDWKDVDTVTLYLNEGHQKQYHSFILSLHPKRIIFNPGAENDVLSEIAKTNNIEVLEACTLVMLSTGLY